MLTCIYPFQVVLHFLPRIIKWHSKFYLSDYLNRLSEKLGRGQREGVTPTPITKTMEDKEGSTMHKVIEKDAQEIGKADKNSWKTYRRRNRQ